MAASVEAIFLSTFVLISQNRMAAADAKRAELDLQISLLAEHEVTKLVALVSAIVNRMGVKTDVDPELEELKQDVAPDRVLDEIEEKQTEQFDALCDKSYDDLWTRPTAPRSQFS